MSFACMLHFCHVIVCISSACFSKLASGLFPRCPFRDPTHSHAPSPPSDLVSCACVKRSLNGPSLAKRPWYSTGRPPVKFRAIWRSFDTPTVNRVARNPPFSLQPNTLPKWPKTHLTPLHALGHSITIVWAKTAPHLDSPSSSYLYI